jgi:sugar (pentulose or hexulose) kinase
MLAMTVDFGSTFTKVVVIDLDEEKVVARSSCPSTVDSDSTRQDRLSTDSGRAEARM